MNNKYLICSALLLALSACGTPESLAPVDSPIPVETTKSNRASATFEYSDFYRQLNPDTIYTSFAKRYSKDIPRTDKGGSMGNGKKQFIVLHDIDKKDEIDVLVAYGEAMKMSMRNSSFFC